MEELLNKGVFEIKKVEQGSSKKNRVVIVGTARGGTSMVASVLNALGVNLGSAATPPVYEDLNLSGAFENSQYSRVYAIAEKYDAAHRVWAWKRPSSVGYLDAVDEHLGKPMYIFIYKDILSIANRNAISMLDDIGKGMQRAINEYQKMLNFLVENDVNALLVSYDKAMSDPQFFVDKLVGYLDLYSTEEQCIAAISSMTREPTEYLDKSRITRAEGELLRVDSRRVYGWAKFIYRPESRPLKVDVFVNGEVVVRGDVDRSLQTLSLPDEQSSYQFSIGFPKSLNLKEGDLVRARVVGDVNDLDMSPICFRGVETLAVKGRLGGVINGKVVGWAKTVLGNTDADVGVDLFVNDEKFASTKANIFRKDLLDKFGGDYGFSVDVPEGVNFLEDDSLSIKVNCCGKNINNSPMKLKSSNTTAYVGRLSGVNHGVIMGWAKLKGVNRDVDVLVDIYINNIFSLRIKANKFRKDLSERFGLDCAFEIPLSHCTSVKSGDLISAKVVGALDELENSPLTVESGATGKGLKAL